MNATEMNKKIFDKLDLAVDKFVVKKVTSLIPKPKKGSKLLDVGCGDGNYGKYFKEYELYGVDVQAVNTMRYSGKVKSRNTRTGLISGRTSAFKKAIITLAEGETIDFYSNI